MLLAVVAATLAVMASLLPVLLYCFGALTAAGPTRAPEPPAAPGGDVPMRAARETS
jgi:hypothetical protein